jgi:hypothetical protein
VCYTNCRTDCRFIVVKLPSLVAPAPMRPIRSPFFPPTAPSHVTTYTVYNFYPLNTVAPSASVNSAYDSSVGWVSYRTLRRWTMARDGIQFYSRRRSVGFSPAPSPLGDPFAIPHLSLSGQTASSSSVPSPVCVIPSHVEYWRLSVRCVACVALRKLSCHYPYRFPHARFTLRLCTQFASTFVAMVIRERLCVCVQMGSPPLLLSTSGQHHLTASGTKSHVPIRHSRLLRSSLLLSPNVSTVLPPRSHSPTVATTVETVGRTTYRCYKVSVPDSASL